MTKFNMLDWTTLTILVIGGLNWGILGFFQHDIIASLFGGMSVVSRIIYAIVGLSALYFIVSASKINAIDDEEQSIIAGQTTHHAI